MSIEAKAEVNRANVRGASPLMMAVDRQRVEIVKYLMGSSADPFQQNLKNRSPMSIAQSN